MANYEQLQRLVDKGQLQKGMVISEVADGNAYKYTIRNVIWLNNINSAVVRAQRDDRAYEEQFRLMDLLQRTFFVGYNHAFLLDRQIEQLQSKIDALLEEKFKAL